jgi:dUTP pyrophosphatase
MIKYYVSGSYEPEVATDGSAGLDLYVNSINGNTLGTGVHVQIPSGYVGLLLPRSSWGIKGFQLANTCGVIDSDYRGEIIMVRDPNPHSGFLKIHEGDKVAQLIVVPCITDMHKCKHYSDLSDTVRGSGGFGSTGGG